MLEFQVAQFGGQISTHLNYLDRYKNQHQYMFEFVSAKSIGILYVGIYSCHRDNDEKVDDDDEVDDEDDDNDHDDDDDEEDKANHLVWVMRTVALLAFNCREISAVVSVTLIFLLTMMMMMSMNMVMMMMMITWSSICWVHRGNGKS